MNLTKHSCILCVWFVLCALESCSEISLKELPLPLCLKCKLRLQAPTRIMSKEILICDSRLWFVVRLPAVSWSLWKHTWMVWRMKNVERRGTFEDCFPWKAFEVSREKKLNQKFYALFLFIFTTYAYFKFRVIILTFLGGVLFKGFEQSMPYLLWMTFYVKIYWIFFIITLI